MKIIKDAIKGILASWMRLCTYAQFKLLGVSGGEKIRVIGGMLYIKSPRNRIHIGKRVTIRSSFKANPIGLGERTMLIVQKGSDGRITIGDDVGLSNCTIFSFASVSIGRGTFIGGGACIWDTDYHSIYAEHRLNGNTHIVSKPVEIGEECFIGGGALIMKGVRIGDRSVIGAGSVVTKDVPAGEVWAGNPARFIKKIY